MIWVKDSVSIGQAFLSLSFKLSTNSSFLAWHVQICWNLRSLCQAFHWTSLKTCLSKSEGLQISFCFMRLRRHAPRLMTPGYIGLKAMPLDWWHYLLSSFIFGARNIKHSQTARLDPLGLNQFPQLYPAAVRPYEQGAVMVPILNKFLPWEILNKARMVGSLVVTVGLVSILQSLLAVSMFCFV